VRAAVPARYDRHAVQLQMPWRHRAERGQMRPAVPAWDDRLAAQLLSAGTAAKTLPARHVGDTAQLLSTDAATAPNLPARDGWQAAELLSTGAATTPGLPTGHARHAAELSSAGSATAPREKRSWQQLPTAHVQGRRRAVLPSAQLSAGAINKWLPPRENFTRGARQECRAGQSAAGRGFVDRGEQAGVERDPSAGGPSQ